MPHGTDFGGSVPPEDAGAGRNRMASISCRRVHADGWPGLLRRRARPQNPLTMPRAAVVCSCCPLSSMNWRPSRSCTENRSGSGSAAPLTAP